MTTLSSETTNFVKFAKRYSKIVSTLKEFQISELEAPTNALVKAIFGETLVGCNPPARIEANIDLLERASRVQQLDGFTDNGHGTVFAKVCDHSANNKPCNWSDTNMQNVECALSQLEIIVQAIQNV